MIMIMLIIINSSSPSPPSPPPPPPSYTHNMIITGIVSIFFDKAKQTKSCVSGNGHKNFR